MGGTNERPDFATRSGNELRQLLRLHAASNYSGENRLRIRQFDLVGHTGCWASHNGWRWASQGVCLNEGRSAS